MVAEENMKTKPGVDESIETCKLYKKSRGHQLKHVLKTEERVGQATICTWMQHEDGTDRMFYAYASFFSS